MTMHGFDIDLADEPRMSALAASLGEISTRLGIRSILIRTNVRTHPLMRSVRWERSHGGVLAAIGHLLDGCTDTLLILASIERDRWVGVGLALGDRSAVVVFPHANRERG